ncbi:hypothetical protein CPB86DRAFT_742539 [Serendipita vermifera]|nr:hypothetical protein CPB86DRAFT_742539 [Serendipita vermifera]
MSTSTKHPGSPYSSFPSGPFAEKTGCVVVNSIPTTSQLVSGKSLPEIPEKLESNDRWKGRSHRKLSEDGYRSLSFIATFLAGVQAQVLASTLVFQGLEYDFINTAFLAGLLADIFTAMLSFAAARWFEMLTQDEDVYLQKCWADVEQGRKEDIPKYSYIDKWVSMALLVAPYTMILGLVSFIVGLMILVWTHQSAIIKAVASLICTFCLVCMLPFALKHDRMKVISLLGLKRRSD